MIKTLISRISLSDKIANDVPSSNSENLISLSNLIINIKYIISAVAPLILRSDKTTSNGSSNIMPIMSVNIPR